MFKIIPVKKQGKYNLNVHLQDLGTIIAQAQSAASKGDWELALKYTLKAKNIDPKQTSIDFVKIATPF